ncbi:recombinase family protein, partial [Falsiroseomonas sp. HC035]|uniref:recombinase family protein n=1 Tax=Falsiroseomonas sp. HC035 TaxID=3390999 RepID=UPI003D314756
MPTAYSYVRFSTRSQNDGDSLQRQRADAERYAKMHRLILDTSYTDPGLSAHSGKHVVKGAFGRFVAAVENGDIAGGSILLIEAFDRFSRQDVLKAMRLFDTLLSQGISVVTLEDNQVYTHESVTSGAAQIIVAVVKMQAAFDYSKRLGERVRSAWAAKRLKIADKKMTRWCPAWLELAPDRLSYRPLDKRAAIVRRIFDMYVGGMGKQLIVETLNKEGVGTFEQPGRKARGWHIGYIGRILHNGSVIGEYQPKLATEKDGKRVNIPVGDVLPNYYPPIVDRAVWDRAKAIREDNKGMGGPKSSGVVNLFSGVAECYWCGGRIVSIGKGDRRVAASKRRSTFKSWRAGR